MRAITRATPLCGSDPRKQKQPLAPRKIIFRQVETAGRLAGLAHRALEMTDARSAEIGADSAGAKAEEPDAAVQAPGAESDSDSDGIEVLLTAQDAPAAAETKEKPAAAAGQPATGSAKPEGKSDAGDAEASSSRAPAPSLPEPNAAVFERDLSQMDDDEKPWRKPGADISDYFNYGFNEDTWKQYKDKQLMLRQRRTMTLGSNIESAGNVAGPGAQQRRPPMPARPGGYPPMQRAPYPGRGMGRGLGPAGYGPPHMARGGGFMRGRMYGRGRGRGVGGYGMRMGGGPGGRIPPQHPQPPQQLDNSGGPGGPVQKRPKIEGSDDQRWGGRGRGGGGGGWGGRGGRAMVGGGDGGGRGPQRYSDTRGGRSGGGGGDNYDDRSRDRRDGGGRSRRSASRDRGGGGRSRGGRDRRSRSPSSSSRTRKRRR